MGYLKSKESWMHFVNTLQHTQELTEKKQAKQLLYQAIETALKNKIKPSTGILFSGGIDSTFVAYLAQKLGYSLPCYTVGFEDAPDLQSARKLAKQYQFNVKEIILTQEVLQATIKKVIKILKTSDFVKVGIGCLMYLACEKAKKDGIKVLLTGAGTEDTLCGYEKHLQAYRENRLQEEIKQGLLSLWDRDFSRDFPIAAYHQVQVDSPYLDETYIRTAMKIHNSLKINEEHKKFILREIAVDKGLNKEFAFRKKKAAQYGSRIEREIGKIARKKGYKYKAEYLQSLIL